jgi:hypothetical protein
MVGRETQLSLWSVMRNRAYVVVGNENAHVQLVAELPEEALYLGHANGVDLQTRPTQEVKSPRNVPALSF